MKFIIMCTVADVSQEPLFRSFASFYGVRFQCQTEKLELSNKFIEDHGAIMAFFFKIPRYCVVTPSESTISKMRYALAKCWTLR